MLRLLTVSSRKLLPRSSWFLVGLAGVVCLAAALRFWGLGRFNTLVFDEVYFAKFGYNYLNGTPFFDAHPPLGKYLIALGIRLGGFNPFGYRWMNALTGSLIPLLIAAIAYELSRRRSYALIAGLFAAVDGLLLVESRYALINIYLLFFGLLGQWLFLLALNTRGAKRWLRLSLAGASLGGAIAVKWNGLGFLLGIYLIWICAWGIQKFISPRSSSLSGVSGSLSEGTPLQKLGEIHFLQLFLYIPIIAFLVYRLEWGLHLRQNPSVGFWQLQQQMLSYHERIGNGPSVHPYCSTWFTWPLMIRPVVYFYHTALTTSEPVPVVGPRLPQNAAKVIYDVHAMGNPALWWLSTAAIVILIWALVRRIEAWFVVEPNAAVHLGQRYMMSGAEFWLPLYLVLNYSANLLPWIDVSRCTFLYHYMPASLYSLMAIAWLVDRWLQSVHPLFRGLGITIIFLVLLAFVFWLPIYLGLPLSPEGFRMRMWFPSWI